MRSLLLNGATKDFVILDDFIPDLDNCLGCLKKVSLYDKESNPDYFGVENVSFPGKRSMDMFKENPFFVRYFLKILQERVHIEGDYILHSYLHLRPCGSDKEDFVHVDNNTFSGVLYLSETNLESGTAFYDDKENMIDKINFVQNRLILFPAHLMHCSVKNHGLGIDTGRLTFNAFFQRAGN